MAQEAIQVAPQVQEDAVGENPPIAIDLEAQEGDCALQEAGLTVAIRDRVFVLAVKSEMDAVAEYHSNLRTLADMRKKFPNGEFDKDLKRLLRSTEATSFEHGDTKTKILEALKTEQEKRIEVLAEKTEASKVLANDFAKNRSAAILPHVEELLQHAGVNEAAKKRITSLFKEFASEQVLLANQREATRRIEMIERSNKPQNDKDLTQAAADMIAPTETIRAIIAKEMQVSMRQYKDAIAAELRTELRKANSKGKDNKSDEDKKPKNKKKPLPKNQDGASGQVQSQAQTQPQQSPRGHYVAAALRGQNNQAAQANQQGQQQQQQHVQQQHQQQQQQQQQQPQWPQPWSPPGVRRTSYRRQQSPPRGDESWHRIPIAPPQAPSPGIPSRTRYQQRNRAAQAGQDQSFPGNFRGGSRRQ